ncbi:MAG: hypothetical protein SO206_06340 [Bacilli bacterium]|nr:hypothetical protein [Bacilli bacterium]
MLASGDTYNNGDTGGESEHTLSVDELATHNHIQMAWVRGNPGWPNKTYNYYGVSFNFSEDNFVTPNTTYPSINLTMFTQTGDEGTSKPHNNMPPYLVVNIWKRVS